MSKPWYIKILDVYIKAPLAWDAVISFVVISIYAFLVKFSVFKDILLKDDVLNDFFSDLISTAISLAGFVITALTIIVTFKDNIQSRASELNVSSRSPTGIELFFNSRHYNQTVRVFFWAAFFLICCFLFLSLIKLFITAINTLFYTYILFVSILMISFTVFRSLLVLFVIIDMQIHSNRLKHNQ